MRSTVSVWLISIAALAAAIAIRWLLDPVMGDTLPLVTTFGAVAAAVWVGGVRPAILVTVVGYLVSAYLFIQPRGGMPLDLSGNLVGFLAYLFTCALIIAFGDAARRAKDDANERREILRVTLHSIGDGVITTDNDGRVTYLNTVAETLTGWTRHEAQGRPLQRVFQIVNEETRQTVENPAVRALREGVVVGLANHTILIRKNGQECAIDDSAAPIMDDQGDVSGCVLIFRDVTVQREVERAKTEQLQTARLLAAIVESSDDAILSKSLDGTIRSWNAGAERIFGHTAADAIGKHISLIIPEDRIAEEDRIISTLRSDRRIEHFETERVTADGRRIIVSLSISPIKNDAGEIVGASKIARDITAKKESEAERERLATLVENSTDFIGIADTNGVPFFINRAGLALVGLTSMEDARRTSVRDFFFPEDQDRVMNQFFPQVQKDGHGEIEVRFRNFTTGEARWMAYKVVALKNPVGEVTAYATVSQDITQRKNLADHLQKLAADLAEADKRKNEFLAILAHELRNPLAPISNTIQSLRLQKDAFASKASTELLERQVVQMSRLVDDLLDMSRISRGKIVLRRERVELGPIVQQAVDAARALNATTQHELTVDMPTEPVYLDADGTRIAQVVGNLLSNAFKFTDARGQVGVRVEPRNGEVAITVSDNGIGIAADQIPRLFEMFMQVDTSLDRSRDGLGIGLTLVKSLVDMHGGSVFVKSDGPGKGSTFTVTLPTVAGAPETREAVVSPVETAARRVLVVDDNVDGAESLAMLLKLSGHDAHVSHDGREAIARAEELHPDVILLDIGLPHMNGYEVARHIRGAPWGKNVLLIAVTGWGQEDDRSRSTEAGFDMHLVKPVDLTALMGAFAAR